MPAEDGEKTELPTEHRRAEVRRQGNVARSVDLNSAVMMFGTAIVLYVSGGQFVNAMSDIVRTHLQARPFLSGKLDAKSVTKLAWDVVGDASRPAFSMMLMLAGVALLVNLVQFGWVFSPEVVQPQFGRISPLQGLKRIFSVASVFKLMVSLCKLIILLGVTIAFAVNVIPLSARTAGHDISPIKIGRDLGETTVELAFLLSIALLVLGVLDYMFQKWKHERDMMMTRQELREEMKQLEGDQEIRQRRRETHRKLANSKELQQVPTADAVITNPTHIAVAIKYDPDVRPAPYVVAKGTDALAARIREIAAEHGVPILERKPLARALYRDVKVGQMVPAEMYDVFVQIMAYVYQITGRQGPKLP
ncbi:MAG: EscU/YscU/HrcU family type III secretion system export apparatus switch protein [Planctomycetota bacterium]|nr:EscU/YscU/HrcU family type III secretion system export apparatus switch protein [Planctomycetota bacterium]